jgi:hypothetical protein
MKIKLAQPETLPQGEHTLWFRKWEHTKSTKGNLMLVLTHTPESGSPEIKDYVCYETPLGAAKLVLFLDAFAISIDGEFETDDLYGLYGLEFKAKTKNEKFNGIFSTQIEEYLPAPEFDPELDPDKTHQLAKNKIDEVNLAKKYEAQTEEGLKAFAKISSFSKAKQSKAS